MRWTFLLCLLFTFMMCARAQAQDSTSAHRLTLPLGWGFDYPSKAVDAQLQGTVVLSLTFDTLCRILDKRILEDIGMGCGTASLKSINANFELATMKLNKFKCSTEPVQFEVHFQLEE